MDKKYLIKIVDSHETDGDKSVSELTTVGSFTGNSQHYSISYTETDEAMQGAVTTLEVENKSKIVMTRRGSYATQLILEKARRHTCCYETPFGELMMGVYATSIRSDIDENGGRLNFRYTLDFNSGLASINELTITVTAAQADN